jgi:hypothetical protein
VVARVSPQQRFSRGKVPGCNLFGLFAGLRQPYFGEHARFKPAQIKSRVGISFKCPTGEGFAVAEVAAVRTKMTASRFFIYAFLAR